MHELMDLAWASWSETRQESQEFLDRLVGEELTAALPRPGLDTLGKHFQELAVIQVALARGLARQEMDFSEMACEADEDLTSSREGLTAALSKADAEWLAAMESIEDPVALVDWGLPRSPSALEHAFWLMQHETFHHGQFAAFCYVLEIELPSSLREHWSMPRMRPGYFEQWLERRS